MQRRSVEAQDSAAPSAKKTHVGKGRCYPYGPWSVQIARSWTGRHAGRLGVFVAGLLMVAAGGYLLLNQVQVTTSYWSFGGQGSFGLSLLPLLAGIAFLFFDGRSLIGWLLTAVGGHHPGRRADAHGDLLPPDVPVQHAGDLGLLFGGSASSRDRCSS